MTCVSINKMTVFKIDVTFFKIQTEGTHFSRYPYMNLKNTTLCSMTLGLPHHTPRVATLNLEYFKRKFYRGFGRTRFPSGSSTLVLKDHAFSLFTHRSRI